MASKTYTSAAPLTMVRLVDGGYRNVLEGEEIAGEAVLPDDLERLVRKKFLIEVDRPAERAPAKKADPGGDSKVPTIKEITDGVGDDPEKAKAALEAEQSRGDDARSSLVEKLEAVIAKADTGGGD